MIKNAKDVERQEEQESIIAFDDYEDDTNNQFEPGLNKVEKDGQQLPQLQRVQANLVQQQIQEQQPKEQSDNSSVDEEQQQNQSMVDFDQSLNQSVIQEQQVQQIEQVVEHLEQREQQPIQEEQPRMEQRQSNIQNRGSPFPPKFPLQSIKNWLSSDENRLKFLTTPLPANGTFQCYIRRSKQGLARLYPVYHMYTTEENYYLCSAKKVVMNTTSNYLISSKPDEFSKRKPSFLGRVVSNFLGTEFILYDNGLNPKKTKDLEAMRCQLGIVYYESHIMANKGPRKMKVLLPKVSEIGIAKPFQPRHNKEGIQFDYQQGNKQYITEFSNKPPKWDSRMKAHVLNFYGRVDQPSVKNFQLITNEDPNFIHLQFGRVDNLSFNLDFCQGISPLQALEICVSSFDFKFACE